VPHDRAHHPPPPVRSRSLPVTADPLDADGPLASVEWSMLFFFAAQFVMVEAAAELGLIDMLGGWLAAAIRAAPDGARCVEQGGGRG
jgi:hypothetical protein